MDSTENVLLQRIAGGVGCDLVTGTGLFKARIGKIYAVISNADGSQIDQITEVRSNIGTAVDTVEVTGASGRSYISTVDTTAASGGVNIDNNKLVVLDNPATHIKLGTGSFWVYYVNV